MEIESKLIMAAMTFPNDAIVYDSQNKELFPFNFYPDERRISEHPNRFRLATAEEVKIFEKTEFRSTRYVTYDAEKYEQIRALCQNYINLNYKDVGCNSWNEMQRQMTDEIFRIINHP